MADIIDGASGGLADRPEIVRFCEGLTDTDMMVHPPLPAECVPPLQTRLPSPEVPG